MEWIMENEASQKKPKEMRIIEREAEDTRLLQRDDNLCVQSHLLTLSSSHTADESGATSTFNKITWMWVYI